MVKDIKVIIAAHKKYEMPENSMYLPLHVGAEGKKNIGYTADNSGDNISSKNPRFCELTGLYWAWKNLDNEYIGLSHYRRHFVSKRRKKGSVIDNVLGLEEASELLKGCDVILPNKRNYLIENLYDHYKHTLYVEPLDETRNVIKEKYPEYLEEFDKLKKRTKAHMFNMMIMKKEVLDEYCTWLFDILFELENRVDESEYDSFHKRFYGRISELLLDVFIFTNHIEYKEVCVKSTEKVNWFVKGTSFLKAKFGGSKYGKSF